MTNRLWELFGLLAVIVACFLFVVATKGNTDTLITDMAATSVGFALCGLVAGAALLLLAKFLIWGLEVLDDLSELFSRRH